jgi:uncharacterized protein (TIGR02466 family)
MADKEEYTIIGMFPTFVYGANRGYLSPKEEEEIDDVIKDGTHINLGNFTTDNSYIFNEKLKELKQFCEHHIKIYVEQIFNPQEELDFYITQSWLNITKPGGHHHIHKHANSIISGVFYVATEEDDSITFTDPRPEAWQIKFTPKEYDTRNSPEWWLSTPINELILFPSWLNHGVKPRNPEKVTKDRISISFNTFVKGNVGDKAFLTELIL